MSRTTTTNPAVENMLDALIRATPFETIGLLQTANELAGIYPLLGDVMSVAITNRQVHKILAVGTERILYFFYGH